MPINISKDALSAIKIGEIGLVKAAIGINEIFPNVKTPVSFSATSTNVPLGADWIGYSTQTQGVAYNPSDGFLYTLERTVAAAGGYNSNTLYLIKRNATTGALVSVGAAYPYASFPLYGLSFDSNDKFYTILRSAPVSKVRIYNSSGVFQTDFILSGYGPPTYADDIAIDSNNIIYILRGQGTLLIYKYNTSGTSQGSFTMGNSNNIKLFASNDKLWAGGATSTWFGRTISTSTNGGNFVNNNTYGNSVSKNEIRFAGYNSVNEILWNAELFNNVWVIRKYTPNF